MNNPKLIFLYTILKPEYQVIIGEEETLNLHILIFSHLTIIYARDEFLLEYVLKSKVI